MTKLTLEIVTSQWHKDSKVTLENLAEFSLGIPQLHSKYLGYYSLAKRNYNTLNVNLKKIEVALEGYYSANTDKQLTTDQCIELLNRPRLSNRLYTSESSVKRAVETDELYIENVIQVNEAKVVVEALEHIIKSINNLSFTISNTINYLKFKDGS